ncbi:hypothetical protein [Actinoplanes sp. NPDC023714]|uniref:hypothetical protein n=1 Tax=Actinoplanes sp. NPDC023714 TaxID=3154322 RepID=UPI0033D63702
MTSDGVVLLQFVTPGDPARAEDLLRELHHDVADLFRGELKPFLVTAPAPRDEVPAKDVTAVAEWVGVAATAAPVLIDLLRLAAEWAGRAKNPVRVKLGDDELVLGNATAEQQQKIVDAFVARHGET